MTRLARRLAMVGVALATAGPLLAQTYHGGLRGAVRESGGVVPGVSRDHGQRGQRGDPEHHDQPRRRVRVRPGRARNVHRQGRPCRASRPSSTRGSASAPSSSSPWTQALEVGSLAGAGHGRGRGRRARDLERLGGQHRSTRRRSRPCPRPAATRSSSRPSRPRSPTRATRSSSGSRTRPTPRCCPSGAGRGAATTTRSTASPSWTSATAPPSSPRSRRWKRSRSRSAPTTRRWGAPAGASST